MSKAIQNVRNLRKRGKTKLVRIADQMNDLAWDLSEKNDKVGDAHTAKSIAMMDESLALMQRALGLLNSVSIAPELMAEEKAPAKKANAGLFGRKKADDNGDQDLAPDVSDRAPIASIKPQA